MKPETQTKILEKVRLMKDILEKSKTNKDLIKIYDVFLESLNLAEEDLKGHVNFKELADTLKATEESLKKIAKEEIPDSEFQSLTIQIKNFTEILKKIPLEKLEEISKILIKKLDEIAPGMKCYCIKLRVFWDEYLFCVSEEIIKEAKKESSLSENEIFLNFAYLFAALFKFICVNASKYGILNMIHLPKREGKLSKIVVGHKKLGGGGGSFLQQIYKKEGSSFITVGQEGIYIFYKYLEHIADHFPMRELKEYVNTNQNEDLIKLFCDQNFDLTEAISHELSHIKMRSEPSKAKYDIVSNLLGASYEAEADIVAAFTLGFSLNDALGKKNSLCFYLINHKYSEEEKYLKEGKRAGLAYHNPFESIIIRAAIMYNNAADVMQFISRVREILVGLDILLDKEKKENWAVVLNENLFNKPDSPLYNVNVFNYGIFTHEDEKLFLYYFPPKTAYPPELAYKDIIPNLNKLVGLCKEIQLTFSAELIESQIELVNSHNYNKITIPSELIKNPNLMLKEEGLFLMRGFLINNYKTINQKEMSLEEKEKLRKISYEVNVIGTRLFEMYKKLTPEKLSELLKEKGFKYLPEHVIIKEGLVSEFKNNPDLIWKEEGLDIILVRILNAKDYFMREQPNSPELEKINNDMQIVGSLFIKLPGYIEKQINVINTLIKFCKEKGFEYLPSQLEREIPFVKTRGMYSRDFIPITLIWEPYLIEKKDGLEIIKDHLTEKFNFLKNDPESPIFKSIQHDLQIINKLLGEKPKETKELKKEQKKLLNEVNALESMMVKG